MSKDSPNKRITVQPGQLLAMLDELREKGALIEPDSANMHRLKQLALKEGMQPTVKIGGIHVPVNAQGMHEAAWGISMAMGLDWPTEFPTHLPSSPSGTITKHEAAAAAWAVGDTRERIGEARDQVVRAVQNAVLDMLRPAWPDEATPDTMLAMFERLAELDETGVSGLSNLLADQLRRIPADPVKGEEDARYWLDEDRARQAAENHPQLSPYWEVSRIALPSWTAIHGDDGAPKSLRTLAESVFRHVVEPRLIGKYPTPSVISPIGRAIAGNRGRDGRWGEQWDYSGMDAALLRKVEQAGILQTVEAHALLRSLPEMARIAANMEGQNVELFDSPSGCIRACTTQSYLTEVVITGGWATLAEYLQRPGGRQRRNLRQAAHTLAHGAALSWGPRDGVRGFEGTTTLITSLIVQDGLITFALPAVWWPGFSAMLADATSMRGTRRRIPMNPSMPPTTSPKLGEAPARLENEACLWMREHVDQLQDEGAPVPWEELADKVELSSLARPPNKRRKTLQNLLTLWVKEGRWVRVARAEGDLWRPAFGWSGVGGFLESRDQVQDGRAAAARKRRKKDIYGRFNIKRR